MYPPSPRKLRLLRIIDTRTAYFVPDPTIDTPYGLNAAVVIPDGESGEPVHRITGCLASQKFWQAERLPELPPDLLLVDINFAEDNSSPLRRLEPKIPTGLLHSLPFLAWARTSRWITAVAFHTGDRGLFTTRAGGASQIMKLLAAELAAIAGSVHGSLRGEVVDGTSDRLLPTPDGAELDSAAYRWIGRLAEPEERQALEKAVAEYRHLLLDAATMSGEAADAESPGMRRSPRLIIDPEGYAVLMRYVEEAALREDPIRPDSEGWPGLVLIREDGKRDCLSVESLFADTTRALKATHFRPDGDADSQRPWALLDGEPAIHAYLSRLAFWPRLFEAAGRAAALLPTGDKPAAKRISRRKKAPAKTLKAKGRRRKDDEPGEKGHGLHAACKQVQSSMLSSEMDDTGLTEEMLRFLVIHFQVLRHYHVAHAAWAASYQTAKCKLVPAQREEYSLAKYLSMLLEDGLAVARQPYAGPAEDSLLLDFKDQGGAMVRSEVGTQRVAAVLTAWKTRKRLRAEFVRRLGIVHLGADGIFQDLMASLVDLGFVRIREVQVPVDRAQDQAAVLVSRRELWYELHPGALEAGRRPADELSAGLRARLPVCPVTFQPERLRREAKGALARSLGFGEARQTGREIGAVLATTADIVAFKARKKARKKAAVKKPQRRENPRVEAEEHVGGRYLSRLLEEGRAPGWVRELCRLYAIRELRWSDERHWPPFLRGA